MLRCDLISVSALLLSVVSAASVFDRSVHMVYALDGGLGIPSISDSQYLNAFDEGDVTALVPFFLNVANPASYDNMIKSVQAKNITITPGFGKAPSAGDIDGAQYKKMALATVKYTKYMRIENMQGFYDEYGSAGLQSFMTYCKSIGYEHIMMNPWPVAKGGGLVDFDCPICDSAFNAVSVKRSSQFKLEPSPNNWHVVIGPINAVRAKVPNIPVLINYESPGPQEILANMEKQKKGSSLTAFSTTIGDITGKYKSYDLHWAPPLTQSYNSIGLDTWDWIAGELKKIAPPS